MKIVKTSLFMIIIFYCSNSVFAQNVEYGLTGGLTFLLSPSSFTNDVDTLGNSYGFSSDYHIGAKIKATIQSHPSV